MSRANSISKFVNSLTEFLINALADKYSDAKHWAYRYNNMKIFMDPRRVSEPHFYVSIGISEACYGITDGKKIEGSLGNEDAYVQRWAGRTNIQKELEAHWKILKEAVAAEDSDDASKKSTAMSNLRRAQQESGSLEVADVTGTGINKAKRQQREKKKGRFKGFKKDIDKKNEGNNR